MEIITPTKTLKTYESNKWRILELMSSSVIREPHDHSIPIWNHVCLTIISAKKNADVCSRSTLFMDYFSVLWEMYYFYWKSGFGGHRIYAVFVSTSMPRFQTSLCPSLCHGTLPKICATSKAIKIRYSKIQERRIQVHVLIANQNCRISI